MSSKSPNFCLRWLIDTSVSKNIQLKLLKCDLQSHDGLFFIYQLELPKCLDKTSPIFCLTDKLFWPKLLLIYLVLICLVLWATSYNKNENLSQKEKENCGNHFDLSG